MKRKLVRRSLRILAILGILGFALSLESYRELLNTQAGEKTWCNFSEATNCEKAFESPYSHLFGRPISLYGAAVYFLVAALAVLGLVNSGPFLLSSLFHIGLLSFFLLGGTVYFAWALFFRVKTICVLCLTDYLINLTVTGISWWTCWKLELPYASLLRWDYRTTLGSPKNAIRTVVMVVLFVVLGFIIVEQEKRFYLKDRKLDLILSGEVARIPTPWARAFPSKGPADAPIQVILFGDHQCPYCSMMEMTWEDLFERYPGLLRLTAVASPSNKDCNQLALDNTHHPFSCQTAMLAEVILKRSGLDAYWEAQKELFKWGPTLTAEGFHTIAMNFGLSEKEIEAVIRQSKSPKPFELANQTGLVVGVGHLPYNVINGVRTSGYIHEWALLEVMESELKRTGLSLADFEK